MVKIESKLINGKCVVTTELGDANIGEINTEICYGVIQCLKKLALYSGKDISFVFEVFIEYFNDTIEEIYVNN